MDSSVWISGATGLIGALIGGGASVLAQKQQSRALQRQADRAEKAQRAEKAEATADEAVRLLHRIKQHMLAYPGDRTHQQRWDAWNRDWEKLLAQMEVTVLRLRDVELRQRIEEIAELLDHRHELLERGLGGYPLLPTNLCSYGLSCLGTAVRREPLPDEGTSIKNARKVMKAYYEHMEEEAQYYEGYH